MKARFEKKALLLGGIFVLGAILLLLTGLLLSSFTSLPSVEEDVEMINAMTAADRAHSDFVDTFTEIAHTRGGAHAFAVMQRAVFPFNLDLHLLGHEVGDIMYAQIGIEGMKVCTHEFRNACSHTMVVGALLEFGTSAFDDIRQACYEAPGGRGAYTMCFHGLGHGVLAFNAYDMERTIEMCDTLGTADYNEREAIECFGGAVMEIVTGGDHDPEAWGVKRPEYLDPEDPFSFCFGDVVPEKYKPMCYNYMTPYAYLSLNADLGYPDLSVYEETFALCARIPAERTAEREACYGGQGKEFIGIAVGRNFTPGFIPSRQQLQTMYDWCALAKEPDGFGYCVNATMNSLYWGGEQPYQIALEYCSVVDDHIVQGECYRDLIYNVQYYIDDPEYYQAFCAAMSEAERSRCQENLLPL